MASIAFTAGVSAVILLSWQVTWRFGEDTGDAVGLTIIMLAARAIVVFAATSIGLLFSSSIAGRWTPRSFTITALVLGLTSVGILWGWAWVAPRFYAPTLAPTFVEVAFFALLGGLQSFLVGPVRLKAQRA